MIKQKNSDNFIAQALAYFVLIMCCVASVPTFATIDREPDEECRLLEPTNDDEIMQFLESDEQIKKELELHEDLVVLYNNNRRRIKIEWNKQKKINATFCTHNDARFNFHKYSNCDDTTGTFEVTSADGCNVSYEHNIDGTDWLMKPPSKYRHYQLYGQMSTLLRQHECLKSSIKNRKKQTENNTKIMKKTIYTQTSDGFYVLIMESLYNILINKYQFFNNEFLSPGQMALITAMEKSAGKPLPTRQPLVDTVEKYTKNLVQKNNLLFLIENGAFYGLSLDNIKQLYRYAVHKNAQELAFVYQKVFLLVKNADQDTKKDLAKIHFTKQDLTYNPEDEDDHLLMDKIKHNIEFIAKYKKKQEPGLLDKLKSYLGW